MFLLEFSIFSGNYIKITKVIHDKIMTVCVCFGRKEISNWTEIGS